MPVSSDSSRRPLYIDRRTRRLLSDPPAAGKWPVETLPSTAFSTAGSNVIIGKFGAAGAAAELTADVTIQLLNTATTQTIAAARVVAGSTSAAGVLQLTDSTSSTSTTTAATPNAVKTTWDLANTAQANAGSAQLTAASAALAAVNAQTSADAAQTSANAAQVSANSAQATANAALPKAGGTMTGPITFAAGQTLPGYAALATAQSFSAAQRGTVSTLISAATVTPDFAVANNFSLVLGSSVTLANPTSLTAGQSGAIVITQNAVTAYTVAFGANWKFSGGTPTMSTALGSVSTLVYYVESASRITAQLLVNVA